VPPPFNPCKHQDISQSANFETEFTSMPMMSIDKGETAKDAKGSSSTDASVTFLNFTFEEESYLDELRDNFRASRHRK
jgi:hypothetical protein